MRARFIGDPMNGGEGPESLSLFGVDFRKGEWTDVPAAFARKIRGNSHFETEAVPSPDEDEVGELRAELDRKGIKYHPRAGKAKLEKLLKDA